MKRCVLPALAALLVAGSLGGGCGGDNEGEPTVFAVKASASDGGRFTVEAPKSIEAGLVRLKLTNHRTEDPADLLLLRLDDGHSLEDAIEIVKGEEEGMPIPDWFHVEGGLGTTKPGKTAEAELVLQEGTYYLLDSDTGSQNRAAATVEVTGGNDDAELPEVDASIEMNEYSFVTEGLKPGTNRFLLKNAGNELHHTLAFPINEGATLAEAREFLQSEGRSQDSSPLDFEQAVGTAVLDAGREQISELEFQAGRYALVCFITDRAGGPPHLAKGMVREIEVS